MPLALPLEPPEPPRALPGLLPAMIARREPGPTSLVVSTTDGVAVTELLMTAYMSAEQERTIPFPPPDLESFVPAVARGEWNPGRDR